MLLGPGWLLLTEGQNYCSILEKLTRLHDIKQNEKHPYINKS